MIAWWGRCCTKISKSLYCDWAAAQIKDKEGFEALSCLCPIWFSKKAALTNRHWKQKDGTRYWKAVTECPVHSHYFSPTYTLAYYSWFSPNASIVFSDFAFWRCLKALSQTFFPPSTVLLLLFSPLSINTVDSRAISSDYPAVLGGNVRSYHADCLWVLLTVPSDPTSCSSAGRQFSGEEKSHPSQLPKRRA